jgi:hypothetical protein
VGDGPPEAHVPEQALSFSLGNEVTLWGYDLEVADGRPGGAVQVALYWRAEREIEEDYTVFVHLVDADGRMWGQQDNEPEGGFYRTSFWDQGEVVRDEYQFTISEDAPLGEYQIEVGMYVLASGLRLPVIDEEGQTVGDRIPLDAVTVSD